MKTIALAETTARMIDGLSALANPARAQVLEILASEPESIVADIVRRLPIAQSTVSQHLRVLQEAGLLHGEQAGASRCCRIDFHQLLALAEAFTRWTHELAATSLEGGRREGETCRL